MGPEKNMRFVCYRNQKAGCIDRVVHRGRQPKRRPVLLSVTTSQPAWDYALEQLKI